MKAKHMLLMLACCALPIVAIVAVSVFKVPLGSVLTTAMILACPLSHILMMKFMMQGHGHDGHANQQLPAAQQVVEAREQ